ncbi:MAG TPA: BRO family protein [Candidatus Nitrosocosmicus sp.]|nr:BRO family protein [Candidatus Nitrosocosmicus sp.]
MNEIQIFRNKSFNDIRVIMRGNEPWFVAKDIAETLGYATPQKMYSRLDADEKTTVPYRNDGSKYQTNMILINESGLYNAIIGSQKEEAKHFRRWVTSEVLPVIRKTGGYVHDNKLFIDTYLPFADEKTKIMFNAVLNVVKEQNKLVQRQQVLIEHKEDIINGLSQEISLADKRQLINRIVKQAKGSYKGRWVALYREFEAKHHMNLKTRLDNYNKNRSPKLKNSIDYIDKVLGMIPDLFEIACKLFEGEVGCLIEQMYGLRSTEIPEDV